MLTWEGWFWESECCICAMLEQCASHFAANHPVPEARTPLLLQISFSLVSLVLSIQTLIFCFIFVGFVGPVHSNIDFMFHFCWFRWSWPLKHWFSVSFLLVSLVLSIQTLILYFIFVGFVGPVHSNYYSIIVL